MLTESSSFRRDDNLRAVSLTVPRLGVFMIACNYTDGIMPEPGMMSKLMASHYTVRIVIDQICEKTISGV
jgi:hypothetical protein